MRSLVIHVPHASTFIPPMVRGQFVLNDAALAAEAEESADRWTDVLAREAWPDAVRVEAPVARLVVDVERYPEDAEEPMARVGRGMIYENGHDGRRIRRSLGADEKSRLREAYYEPHWAFLRRTAAGATLIDLHTYPVRASAVELDAACERPEVVLGTDPRLTPAGWAERLAEHFAGHGWSVGVNRPYGGVIDAGSAAAIMFEIRRDVVGTVGSRRWERLASALRSAPLPDH